ncbi:MAG TPA: DUF5990 family protein [Flavisolibacter sp.]|nr:DUF5990 family protein [Flavisolibacter sp.]
MINPLVDLTLQIALENSPKGVLFGIQKGSGSQYETIQAQSGNGETLNFECTIRLKKDQNGRVDFSGPMVQGPPGVRFIYIDIGTAAGQHGSEWSRRLKIPLSGYLHPGDDLTSLPADITFKAGINGIGKDGTPACGTVKNFEGWKISKQG